MKFIEKLRIDRPNMISDAFIGGAYGCPYMYEYEKYSDCDCNKKCRECWNREMSEIKSKTKPKMEFVEFDLQNFIKDISNGIKIYRINLDELKIADVADRGINVLIRDEKSDRRYVYFKITE